jgi:hypothetical protein
MLKPDKTRRPLAAPPVYLAAQAINSVICVLPAGTAYFIGIVLITMCTGQLVHHQGSLARAALPDVVHLRWGWHRVERALERGQVSLDTLFERAVTWCLASLPVEPVRLGSEQRTVHAIDSSTVARLRANKNRSTLLGQGDCHRAQRAVQANLVAVLTTVVVSGGVRVGLVRRTRFGATCPEAVAHVFADLPVSTEQRLFRVDAGIATSEQFRTATAQDARVGRLRKNVSLRQAPPPRRSGKRGHPGLHDPVLHPGAQPPEGHPDEDTTIRVEDRAGVDHRRDPRGLSPALAGGDQLLRGSRHVCDGDAAGVECPGRGAPHQLGAVGGLAAQGHCRRVSPAADGAVGPQARRGGGAVGHSLESPGPAFCPPLCSTASRHEPIEKVPPLMKPRS